MLRSKLRTCSWVLIDLLAVNLATFFAYLIRESLSDYNIGVMKEYQDQFWKIVIVVSTVRLVTFFFFKLYKPVWKYASVSEFLAIVQAVAFGTLVFVLLMFFSRQLYYARGVVIIDAALCLLLVGVLKFSSRFFHEYQSRSVAAPRTRVLIVGTGAAGVSALREIKNHPEKGYSPIGFVDDDLEKQKKSIQGTEVLGTTRDIASIVRKHQIDEIVIAIPSAPGSVIREIVKQSEKTKAKFKIVPGIHAILDGRVRINQIREVQLEDLIGRKTLNINLAEISSYLSGKRVMVTGAGGSIGSELCRQIAKFNPELLIMLGRGENSLYHIDIELNEEEPFVRKKLVIADVKDRNKIEKVLAKYKPQIIFHAAAHKHVAIMEENPEEAVKNNVIGTLNMVDMAIKYHIEKFILVSTDKAVKPTNIYGASKRVAEELIRCKTNGNGVQFMSVRFGNVLDSRGSVLPMFRRQIAKGGPLTVTHKEATRYFMTIPEAVQLLIQAGAMGQGGEIFVLDMGDAIKILDLAKDLITLSGLEVDKDIKIEFTGLKPGEKLCEELLTPEEGMEATKHERIFVTQPKVVDEAKLTSQIASLHQLAEAMDTEGIVEKFKQIIPTYRPNREMISEPSESEVTEVTEVTEVKKSAPHVISLPLERLGDGKRASKRRS